MKTKPYNQPFRLCLSLVAAGFCPHALGEELLFTLAPSSSHSELGSAFAAVGDLNADGVTDVAIADRSAFVDSSLGSGIVHIVSGADGSSIRDYNGTPAASQSFGSSLATLDANGDGVLDLAVGSPGQAGSSGFGAGAVRIYSGTDGSLLATATGPAAYQLGGALTNAGDQNGDGVDDLYAGAPGANTSRGAVLVLSGADGSVVRTITATTSSTAGFALTLATLGDIDGDGRPDLAAGSPGFRVSGNQAGRVLLIRSSDGAVATQIVGTKIFNRLGESLAATPDLSGDGLPDLLVGSYSGGTAMLLSGADFSVLKDLSITLPSFRQLAVGGCLDFDGDGTLDFLLGSPALQTVNANLVGGVRVVSGSDGSSLFEDTATTPLTGLGLSMKVLPGLGFAVGEPNLLDPLTNGHGSARVWRLISDSDGDGVPDNIDQTPNSIVSPTVMILGLDSQVPNRVNEEGVTLADLFAEPGEPSSYENPAQYQVEIVHLSSELVEAGLLTEAEADLIHAALVQSLKPLRGKKK